MGYTETYIEDPSGRLAEAEQHSATVNCSEKGADWCESGRSADEEFGDLGGGTLFLMFGDHLGSTSLVTFGNGNWVSETRYKPWGEVRYPVNGQNPEPSNYTYTGQYSAIYINLLWYGSRYYDPALGRFTSPDKIVPLASQGVQAWDRYAYVNNSPINYTDPSGHDWKCTGANEDHCYDDDQGTRSGMALPTSDYLNEIARKYKINLAPGDKWEFTRSIMFGDQAAYGWNPYKPNEPYRDVNGTQHKADDSSVFITNDLFKSCDALDCVAGIMAHEATHSWVEFKVEATGQEINDTDVSLSAAEEIFADLTAIRGIGDPTGRLDDHKYDQLRSFNDPRTSDKYLEDYYKIDLSDIYFLVYER